ncbi:hypothetical protein K474DRAFT_1658195 [Panus rudis PR-1116 ss-1]|nr:hypothetical protein K474DRAFT_1658195 [Panus rudis PR-1116 ss-1]
MPGLPCGSLLVLLRRGDLLRLPVLGTSSTIHDHASCQSSVPVYFSDGPCGVATNFSYIVDYAFNFSSGTVSYICP